MKIPFISKLARFKNIENRNKEFDKLTKKQQRQEIAFDALHLVINQILRASKGCYWNHNLNNIKDNTEDSKELQNSFLTKLTKKAECFVCQRGLMMVSQIRLNNNIDPNSYGIQEGDDDIIKGFTIGKFQDMEDEYEKNYYNHPYGNNTNHKLANICCNVINNGNFYENDKKDYLTLWGIKIKE